MSEYLPGGGLTFHRSQPNLSRRLPPRPVAFVVHFACRPERTLMSPDSRLMCGLSSILVPTIVTS